MEVIGRVKHEWDTTEPALRPIDILVDAIGLGAGAAPRLQELGLPARGINVSESPAMKGQYVRLKDELWYKARAWFEGRDTTIPRDEDLIRELVTPRYSFTSSGKVSVEGKSEIRKRGLPSGDAADSFVLTFASNAATAGGRRHPAKQAIKRRIRGVV
jgi:phage terminase large subunit